jgi:hypothetical protein
MSTRKIFDFRWEPRGDAYRSLVRAVATVSDEILFIIADGGELDPEGKAVLDKLISSGRCSLERAKTDYGPGRIYRVALNETVISLVSGAADGLFWWYQPHMPTDLCFMRNDRTAILSTLAHHHEGNLEVSDHEMSALCNVFPGIADLVKERVLYTDKDIEESRRILAPIYGQIPEPIFGDKPSGYFPPERGIDWLLAYWRDFAIEVEGEYYFDIYVYGGEFSLRDRIQVVLDQASPGLRRKVIADVEDMDRVFRELTIDRGHPVPNPVQGLYPKECSPAWWWTRIPKSPGYRLKDDLDKGL